MTLKSQKSTLAFAISRPRKVGDADEKEAQEGEEAGGGNSECKDEMEHTQLKCSLDVSGGHPSDANDGAIFLSPGVGGGFQAVWRGRGRLTVPARSRECTRNLP
jgi:hypothetical protein